MTDSAHVLDRVPASPGASRLRIARLVACCGAIAACVPYLTLKIAWLAGSSVGTVGQGTAEMADTKHVVGNAVTMGMDLVAIVVALAFTCRWGQRLPAWLVLIPIWVGTGLLAPIALGVPLGIVVQGFAGGSPIGADNGLHGWVYGVVYGGFTVQGIMLVATFVLYALARWTELFRMRTADLRAAASRPRRTVLVTVAAVVATGYGVIQLVWAIDGGALGGYPAAVQTATQQTFWATQGVLSIAGVLGLLTLVHRWGRGRFLLPLAAAWIGTGVIFASGLYAATVEGAASPVRLFGLLLGASAGLLMAAAGLRLLAEHHRTPAEPHAAA
ncbi:hypothetical protein [Amycolatopsis sp. H20-H5]|uniref:hypothetical protein n=1 Tax=Amycolatopsis sp. H20-H5 TaxID=3046309 RepID=UPI002DB91DBB|nr:hypothetical protein [Amycolatopsis sp. H20-H5]MEC3979507.1 hypothetical protein [Amycolatopsis sp. H20-H5]